MPRILTVTLALCLGFPLITAAQEPAQSEASAMMRLGLRGAYFVPNQGQWSDAEVHYGLRSRGLDVAFRESAFTMHLSRGSDDEPSVAPEKLTLIVSFPGSNDVEPVGAQPQTAKFNYFVGGKGRGTAGDVPSFAEVVYGNIYDGIDLHVMGNDDGVLKYEFRVAPGADHSQIRIAYDGVESLCIDDVGSLRIDTLHGTLRDSAPEVWQENDRIRTRIPSRFELEDDHTYRIALEGAVDLTRPLIIDPELEWMYYFGGSYTEGGHAIAVDQTDDMLVTGRTLSFDFIGRNNSHHGGAWDAFALKISPSGQLRWMTYFGGSGDDSGYGIAVDSAGNVFVAGQTDSTDFAGGNNTNHGGLWDSFAVKITAPGQLEWMTYLGGSGSDYAWGIGTDTSGSALVAGHTESNDFDGRNNSHYGGLHDVFAIRVDSSGQQQWMTYLGGGLNEIGYAIAADSVGNALVTGHTNSTDFVARNNSYHGGSGDAFVVKINSLGQHLWMSYLGGSAFDGGSGIAVDSGGAALVTGQTASTDFLSRTNSHHGGKDAIALKVSATGQPEWMTYFGGTGDEWGHGIATDDSGGTVVTGQTVSIDFSGKHNSHYGGPWDAFVVRCGVSGQLEWMMYLGGSANDYGLGAAVNRAGSALLTGQTDSTDFSGRSNSYYGGTSDVFLLKFRGAGPHLSIDATCPAGGPIRISWEGATPGGQVAVIFARNTGSFTIPPQHPCAGTQLELGSNQIQIAFQGSAGSEGSRTLNSNAGSGACGGYLQLLDLSTCGTSNVVRIK